MQSNLTLLATFTDTSRPTLTISAPTANQKMTNALATGRGTAADNWQLNGVWYQLNSNSWAAAVTTNGYTNWSTPTMTLINGTNSLKAYSVDLAGNLSTTSSVSFVSSNTFQLFLGLTTNLTLTSTGLTVRLQLSPGLNGQVQSSTNLVNWTVLTNFLGGTNTVLNIRDPGAATNSQRFYRAVIP
jgi:hypothetical protein